ncbi:hypothetical protein [Streptosporangium sp. NPDC000396]|uniref:hypothetical protein n=1 Tax=Streptosporangium sp. NPDC000396 TaxID=3366185 RepID=UPI00368F78B9
MTTPCHRLFALPAETGMRLGEALDMRISDSGRHRGLNMTGVPEHLRVELAWMAHWRYRDGAHVGVTGYRLSAVVLVWAAQHHWRVPESLATADPAELTRLFARCFQARNGRLPAADGYNRMRPVPTGERVDVVVRLRAQDRTFTPSVTSNPYVTATKKTLTLAALTLVSAATLYVPAANAATTMNRPACPAPSKAEIKRSYNSETDKPPRGATAIEGVRVDHIPKGFIDGQVVAEKRDGTTEYGYQWADDRSEIDRKHRFLWVRVVCWPGARRLTDLKKVPISLGTFTGNVEAAKIGGREVLTKVGDGALGAGRYVGWVERKGVIVTVMAGQPLVGELDRIISGITLP